MRKRTSFTLLAVALLLFGLVAVVYLHGKAPPQVARLLPESDAIVYLDLKPLREATHFDQSPVTRSPTYQQFIDATGIVAERDLDRAAFALHAMADPKGPNGPVAFSEVFQGRFDAGRLDHYLNSIALSREDYAGHTIYSIPSENRTLRVSILAYDTVAGSNMPTPEQIHSMIDREQAAASPFSGSSLLDKRYGEVPAFSAAWAIGHIGLPFSENGNRHAHINLLGFELPLPADATFVASLRLAAGLGKELHLSGGKVALRVDEIAPDSATAAASVASLTALMSAVRTVQLAQQPTPATAADKVLREFSDSMKIVQHDNRATLTASVPVESLEHLEAAHPPQ